MRQKITRRQDSALRQTTDLRMIGTKFCKNPALAGFFFLIFFLISPFRLFSVAAFS